MWRRCANQARKGVDVARDAVLERLELDRHFDALRVGMLGELPHVLDDEPEDLLGREHLQIAVVLARDKHDVAAAEVCLLVDVRLTAVERESAHGGHEVDQAERDADRRPHGQPHLGARLPDQPLLTGRHRQRVLEDIV